MTHLIASVVLAVATISCYAPELRDCTVTCGGADTCAGDQVCSAGRCAAEGVSCSGAMVDASGPLIMLRVRVEGTGKVVLAGVGECDDSECTWQVPMGLLRLEAQETDNAKPFERWTTPNCGTSPQVPTCTFTPTAGTTVGAKFK